MRDGNFAVGIPSTGLRTGTRVFGQDVGAVEVLCFAMLNVTHHSVHDDFLLFGRQCRYWSAYWQKVRSRDAYAFVDEILIRPFLVSSKAGGDGEHFVSVVHTKVRYFQFFAIVVFRLFS